MASSQLTPAEIRSRIEKIDRTLASGVASSSGDGQSVSFDHDAMRAERTRLEGLLDRTAGVRRKPVVSTLNLRSTF